jgi:uncharacterized protein
VRSLPTQRLRVLPSTFAVDHIAEATLPPDESWHVLVRAPEGLTVVREVSGAAGYEGERWVGLYGDSVHSLDQPGMLAAVIGPLAGAAVPVFVASTYHADLVLVPWERRTEAVAVLSNAGHEVVVT